MHRCDADGFQIGRRAFLRTGSLVLCASALGDRAHLIADDESPVLRVGLVTDLHHADKPPKGSRFYQESIGKLAEAATQFSSDKIDFVVELGDLIDAAESVEVELGYLDSINQKFSSIHEDRHYVLGNHCVDTLTKEEFLQAVGREQSFYSFDRNGFHFIVLDACFRFDGKPYGRRNSKWTDANLSAEELQWLRADLQATEHPVIVFAHQRLDVDNDHGIKNQAEARAIFESSGKVLAVFQGHSHKNALNDVGGIHYCTLVAMVEGSGPERNGYSVMSVLPDSTIQLTGFREQATYLWDRG
ncbi:MAG: metallophosphoesterase [Planctomycetaceae bacterium]